MVEPGVIAVVRAPNPDQVAELIEALMRGGVTAIEITLTTPDAFRVIRESKKRFAPAALVGVGTVLDQDAAQRALDAGAEFVVTPILRPELVPLVHAAGAAIMLGSYTPSEALAAHNAGADFVKLFPADSLGPAYVKALLAPLPQLRLVPTGGVEVENAADFIRAGCAALGAGSSLVPRQSLVEARWRDIEERARGFVRAVAQGRQPLAGK
jgi:2-dehydro-3-deoxyphosphogluconate aldolase/(4S)-4-hydroxy-2-oxoglutarate aldolase